MASEYRTIPAHQRQTKFPIILNAVQCRQCNELLISRYGHDFKQCAHIFTDGGTDYIRRGGEPADMEDFTIVYDPKSDRYYFLKDLEK